MPTLHFPQKQRGDKLDKKFGLFLEVLKQLHVNIPFIEVLSQMSTYTKFLKEILSNKRKVEEISIVKLIEHCNLADQTTIIPEGIVEDVLVRVDKFVFPMDSMVVNIEENREIPLILGRPFLATSKAILDIQERQLMLRVGEERVVFKIEGAMRALKERTRESKHDKCGLCPKKAEKKLLDMPQFKV
ncbi:uncharacterized protein LOC142165293 [Nicotiana tabacum]|uniref:Uncharacterized protein LOC142165293 n=1 Tax=Nicotiana tabacum TaxID=4097 RepID=A0AC58S4S6_TOBAC